MWTDQGGQLEASGSMKWGCDGIPRPDQLFLAAVEREHGRLVFIDTKG